MRAPQARCHAVRRTHDEAWADDLRVEPDGLTRFQHRAPHALAEAGHALREREVRQLVGGGAGDLYVTGIAGRSDARVYVYRDGVELRTGVEELRLERDDAATPDAMLAALADAIGRVDARP